MPSGFVPENGLVITKFFMRAVQQDVDSALRNLCTTHQCEPSRPPAQSTLGLDLPVVAEGWLWTLESGLWSSKGHSYVSYWRPLLLQSPELAELVDDGGFVLQGVRIATWKSSSS